jgi:hypothetical protein
MKKLQTIKVTAAVAGATLVAAGAVSAAPRVDGPQTLTLLSVQQTFSSVPQIDRRTPPALGDRMFFHDVLYNRGSQLGKPSGAAVGSADNVCTIVSKTALMCTLIAKLPNGQLVATGSVPLNAHGTNFAITGGTGAYATMRGSASGHDLSQTKTVVTIHLG